MHRTANPGFGRNSLPLLTFFVFLVLLAGCGGASPSMAPAYDAAPSRMAFSDSAGAAMEAEAAPSAPEAPAMAPMAAPAPMPSPAPAGAGFVAPAARAVMGAPPPAPPKPAAGDAKSKAQGTEPVAPADKPMAPLLIYVGQLAMRIDEASQVPATLDKVIDLAESLGGYLTSRTDNSVQVRVPSARFREALTGMEKLGEVTRRSVSAEDVSEEFHDLEVRLANLKAVQKRLQEFLAKAQNIQEALQVEHELERVGREIDQIEGRMRFLRARAAFSLITVEVTARPKAAAIADHPHIPPDPRAIDLPIEWLSRIGLDSLLNLR